MQNPAANAAAAGAAAAELVAAEEQAAAKAAAKKAKKQRQKLKNSPPSPQHHQQQQSTDSRQSTASALQSLESSAVQSMASGQQHGKAVEAASMPAASQTAVSQTSAAFLLNLFRCPLSKVSTNATNPRSIVAHGHRSAMLQFYETCVFFYSMIC